MESRQARGDETGLAEYAIVVWRYWWLIAGLCVVAGLAAFAMTITSPKVYESTTTLIAPKEGVGIGLFGGLTASGLMQQAVGFHVPSLTPNRDILMSILKSRSVEQAGVERFRL